PSLPPQHSMVLIFYRLSQPQACLFKFYIDIGWNKQFQCTISSLSRELSSCLLLAQ
ncbi:hypothetical protein L9F63_010534, partial [Diploptera punctata]